MRMKRLEAAVAFWIESIDGELHVFGKAGAQYLNFGPGSDGLRNAVIALFNGSPVLGGPLERKILQVWDELRSVLNGDCLRVEIMADRKVRYTVLGTFDRCSADNFTSIIGYLSQPADPPVDE